MTEDADTQALTYVPESKPDIRRLRKAYDETINDLTDFTAQCRRSYESRRNIWAGKSDDLRKHGGNAFPWDGASDMEAHVTDERIDAFVSQFITASNRATIKAYPVEGNDVARAALVSTFLKWMKQSYIKRYRQEMELSANYMLERGIAITYVGWNKESMPYLQKVDLESLMAVPGGQQLAQLILEGDDDKQVAEVFKQMFPKAEKKRINTAIRDLRKTGEAEIPIIKTSVDEPFIETLSPDGDFFFPAFVQDPQRAPYCFWRTYMTPQELENKIAEEGWDEEWVEEAIASAKSSGSQSDLRTNSAEDRNVYNLYASDADRQRIEVLYVFQRLVGKDGSHGIYCTVMSPHFEGTPEDPLYAKHELLNGYTEYPVVVTRLHEAGKRLYDVCSMAERLRGIQELVKVERDARIDRNSMATLPPILHPMGRPPADWGPGRQVPVMRGGELDFGPTPSYDPGSREIEQTILDVADRGIGLNAEDPLSAQKRQFFVEKFLEHDQKVLALGLKCYQRMGPEQVMFQVTGVPEPQQMSKNANEDFNITIQYDVLNNDPETLEKKLQQYVSLMQIDTNGRLGNDKLVEVVANAIDPILADTILEPVEEAQEKVVKDVTADLSSIYTGIEKGARPNGAQIALKVIQEYISQPDITQRMQADEAFAERIQKYAEQYQFQMQQAQNAQIGKVGTAPASVGGMNTQGF